MSKKLGLTLHECPGCHSRIDKLLVPVTSLRKILLGEAAAGEDPFLKCPVCNLSASPSSWKEHKV